ncbi:MAG: ZIP family metal transporter [Chloroflexi bacterium]|nr:ZIP family metal transporter [Chloroflexota bacterium]
MIELLQVLGVALLAAVLTALGAPLAETQTLSNQVVSGALQLAAGLLTGIVLIELLPDALAVLPLPTVAIAVCLGAAAFVGFDYVSAWKAARQHDQDDASAASISLYVGIMADLFIDGLIIGVATSVGISNALPLAIAVGLGQAPLTFVATAVARRQGTPSGARRRLVLMYGGVIVIGAMLGYLVFNSQSEAVQLTVLAAAGGVLFAAVTQVMIPEAIEALHDAPPSLTGLMYVVGLGLFLVLKGVAG